MQGKIKKFFNIKNKLLCVISIFIIISLLFVIKNVTKKQKNGNNMNSQKIVDNILNLQSYTAKVLIQVNSNKNQNKYIIKQEYSKDTGSIQEVLEPNNIAGIKITRKDNDLKLENTNLDLKTIFENYTGLEDNSLDLINFIEEYKISNKSSFEESDKDIILKVKSNKDNKYLKYKKLYIDKGKMMPKKLVIQDNNQNTTIVIEYIEVELN